MKNTEQNNDPQTPTFKILFKAIEENCSNDQEQPYNLELLQLEATPIITTSLPPWQCLCIRL